MPQVVQLYPGELEGNVTYRKQSILTLAIFQPVVL
jgi:hypothetical protein